MSVGVSSLFAPITVSLVRVKHEFKFLAEVYELIDQLHAVLHMNVVIHYPVREKKNSFEFISMGHHRAKIISLLVIRRPVHVAFCVDSIIKSPVRDR